MDDGVMKENIGKVWLAGAGPGDAGLLTVKAAHLIESAGQTFRKSSGTAA